MEPYGSASAGCAKHHEVTKWKLNSLEDKLELIDQVEKGKKQTDVVEAYQSKP